MVLHKLGVTYFQREEEKELNAKYGIILYLRMKNLIIHLAREDQISPANQARKGGVP